VLANIPAVEGKLSLGGEIIPTRPGRDSPTSGQRNKNWGRAEALAPKRKQSEGRATMMIQKPMGAAMRVDFSEPELVAITNKKRKQAAECPNRWFMLFF